MVLRSKVRKTGILKKEGRPPRKVRSQGRVRNQELGGRVRNS